MEIDVKVLRKQKWYQTQKYEVGTDFELVGHTIPSGFVSDGATVPRWLTPVGISILLASGSFGNLYGLLVGALLAMIPVLFPYIDRYLAAAILHDFLLGRETRKFADAKFLEALKSIGVEPWRAYSMFAAVRIFSLVNIVKWRV